VATIGDSGGFSRGDARVRVESRVKSGRVRSPRVGVDRGDEVEGANRFLPRARRRRSTAVSSRRDFSDDERTSLPIAQIQTSLEATFVDVVDMSGDGRHVTIKVVSKAFEGKNPINRQRMVYKAIWEEMQTDKVHAVQGIVTQTPEEAQ
jgi:acid stress-induced BolA-like protein IbaG/YrbA|tara:strand:- start:1491 stop:1937 length:447 start_codon:yes stop_codon:yes gene_type:complete